MLFLPVRGSNFDRGTRAEAFEGERLQFVHALLIGTEKALQVGLDGESLALRLGADSGFELRMNGNTHEISRLAGCKSDCTPGPGAFPGERGVL
jgi:hypothetical protein